MQRLYSIVCLAITIVSGAQEVQTLPPADANLSSAQLIQWNDELEYYLSSPMSLCESDPNVLAQHPLLTFQQAVNLTYYTHRSGCMMDWGEFGNISGFDQEWIDMARPYFTLNRPESGFRYRPKYYKAKLRLGIKANGPSNLGIQSGNYHGPAFQDGGSFQITAHPYELGLRWQRDAGERWSNFSKGIWDHWSGYLAWRPSSKWTLGFGSYRLGFGGGLLVGNAFGGGRISSPKDIHRRVSNTRLSASAMESGQWAGIQSTFTHNGVTSQVAVGREKLDARLSNDTITTLYSTGLHRTESERNYQQSVRAFNAFVQISYSHVNYKISGCINHIQLSHAYHRTRDYGGASVQLQYLIGAIHLESEMTIDYHGRYALIGSVSKNIDDHHLGVRFENVSLGFQSHPIEKPRLLFSGDGSRAIQAFWHTRFQDGETSVLLFAGRALKNRSEPEVQNGWEWKIGKRLYSVNWSSSIRQRNRGGTTYYSVQQIELSSINPKISFRWNSHFARLTSISHSYALQVSYSGNSHQFTARFYTYNDAETGLNTWLYTPTTSMQMSVSALSGKGIGFNLKWNWEISNHHRIQLAAYTDERIGAQFRGSGNDQTKGKRTFAIMLEYHLRLGTRNS